MTPDLRAHDYPQYAEDLTEVARSLRQACAEETWAHLTTARVVVPVVALVCLETGCHTLATCRRLGLCAAASLLAG